MRKAKVFREAQMRLAKPGIAKGFIHWRGRWELIRQRQREANDKDAEELLQDEEKRRISAEQELARVSAMLLEREQALSMARIALDDERKALIMARTEAAEAKTIAMQGREHTSKLAAAEVQVRQMQQRLKAGAEEMDYERNEAKRRAEQHKLSAEKDLKRLLVEQRTALEAQMAQVAREAEERIKMIEDQCRNEINRMLEQQAQMEEERRKAKATTTEQPAPKRRSSVLHPIWARGPDLNTADRAVAWQEYVKERERMPKSAWAQSQLSADAFRASRRLPLNVPSSRRVSSMSVDVNGVPLLSQPTTEGDQSNDTAPLPSVRDGIVSGRRLPSPSNLRTSMSTGSLTSTMGNTLDLLPSSQRDQ